MSLEFWYMFPVAIVVATIAMSTGVGGAVFFSPIFLLALKLDPAVAIGTALITEFFGFSSGLVAYLRLKLVDFRMAFQILMFAVPAAVIGALLADVFPGEILKTIFGVGIIFIGTQMFTAWRGERREEMEASIVNDQGQMKSAESTKAKRARHVVTDRSGKRYEYSVLNRSVAAVFATIGGAFVGMISVGLAELMEYQMVAKCKIPPPVAIATSIFMVVVTVAAASVGHIVAFAGSGSEAINQVLSIALFTAPGVIIGGQIGPIVQRVIPPETMKLLLAAVFVGVGIIMMASLVAR